MTGFPATKSDPAGTEPHSFAVTDRSIVEDSALVPLIGIAAGMITLVLGGRAGLVPVAVVGVIAAGAAVIDHRRRVIPNESVIAAFIVVVASLLPVAVVDHRVPTAVGVAILSGWLLSGAPALFAVWWLAPALIGGGDWKLLTVLGLALGYVAPLAAPLMVIVALAVDLVDAAVRHHRHVTLGPPLVVGYVAAVVVALARPDLVGSWLPAGTIR